MTFSCNHCQTRYHIADEKVRGKILQVRCRSCQNLVEVKDPELSHSRAPASATSMTLLGISAIPKENSAFAKPATTPAAALPAPSPSALLKPTAPTAPKPSTLPSYGQPRPMQPAVAKPAPPQPLAPKPAALAQPPAPSLINRPAPLAATQPNKPPVAQKLSPVAVRPPAPTVDPKPYTNGAAQIPASIQPAPPPAEPKQWYYNRKGERQGPMRFSELSALIAENKVRPEDYAWSPEIVNWKQIKDISQFEPYLPAEPPPFEAATSLPLPPTPRPQPALPTSSPSAAQPVLPPTPTQAPSQPFMAAVQPAAAVLPPTPTRAPSQPYMAAVAAPPVPTRAPSQPIMAAVQPTGVLPPTPGSGAALRELAANPTPTRAPSQPYLAAVQPTGVLPPTPIPVLPPTPSVLSQSQLNAAQAPQNPASIQAPKPPMIVKSPIAPQMPMPSPSAVAMQGSITQPAGPTMAPSGMFAQNDPFAGVPDAADFKAAPIREMSALIPISAVKPPLTKRLMVPGLIAVAFAVVAVLAFSFGQDSTNQTLGSQQKPNNEENNDNPQPQTNFSDSAIKGLDGFASNPENTTQTTDTSNPKNPKNPKKNPSGSNNEDPLAALNGVHSNGANPDSGNKLPIDDAKLAADNAKATDLFSTKKTAVTPTLTSDNKTKEEPEQSGGSEKLAMQAVNETNIKPCIDRAFTNGDLRKETRLNVSLKTDANGKITSFSVGNAPAGSPLENCLKSSYSRAPLKDAGGAVSLNFPIIASPSF